MLAMSTIEIDLQKISYSLTAYTYTTQTTFRLRPRSSIALLYFLNIPSHALIPFTLAISSSRDYLCVKVSLHYLPEALHDTPCVSWYVQMGSFIADDTPSIWFCP